jgi:hypothetical protein
VTSPDANAVAVATRVMLNLTGRRWTWPRRRVVEEYWVPETVDTINLSGRPVSAVLSATAWSSAAGWGDSQETALDFVMSDAFRLRLPRLAQYGYGWLGVPDRDMQGGVYPAFPAAWWRRRGSPVTVEYIYGNRPPYEVQQAIQQIAVELDRLFNGAECALPQRVTSVSREGVNWTIIDPQQFLEKGRTGLYYPDLVISMYGGGKARARSFSPEHLPPRRFSTTILNGS